MSGLLNSDRLSNDTTQGGGVASPGIDEDRKRIRPTDSASYTDGTGTFHPEHKRIERGASITGERVVTVDACVIGSGAGGAPVAKELAEGGMDVIVLEEGEWWDTDNFNGRPLDMTRKLYRDAGQSVTLGNPPIILPLGKTVGGTTLVNSGTCFRTPPAVLAKWQEMGLEELSEDRLEPYFRRVERELNVSQVPAEIAGKNPAVVKRGADRLGYSGDFIYRNVRGCVGSGVCAFGCPSAAKQHTGITYVPKAWAAGATTYTGTRVEQIVTRNGRVVEVVARTAGGGTLRVRCEKLIVSCGAIYTPLLLQTNRIGAGSGQLGRNLSIHPATGFWAVFDERIDMWQGVPQSYYIDQFTEEGIIFEGIAGPPDYIAVALPSSGERHHELMLDYSNISAFGIMISDTSRGEVRAVKGRPVVSYNLNRHDVATFKRALEILADIYWAAGAHTVITPVTGVDWLRDGDSSPLKNHKLKASQLKLLAFHPLGTARAGIDPASSVVDGDLRIHGLENAYIADGSVVPSSLGVNPQITIMALASRLAFHLLGSDPPKLEPEPARMATPDIPAPPPVLA